jgi:hypothetical protein
VLWLRFWSIQQLNHLASKRGLCVAAETLALPGPTHLQYKRLPIRIGDRFAETIQRAGLASIVWLRQLLSVRNGKSSEKRGTRYSFRYVETCETCGGK